MKTSEEIEKMALVKYPPHFFPNQVGGIDNASRERTAFKKGYTQCQEDMNEVVSFFEEIWEQMNGKTDARGDMVYIPYSLSQKIRNYKNKQD